MRPVLTVQSHEDTACWGSKQSVHLMQWHNVWSTMLCDSSGSQPAHIGVSDDNGSRKLTYQLEEAAHGAITTEARL